MKGRRLDFLSPFQFLKKFHIFPEYINILGLLYKLRYECLEHPYVYFICSTYPLEKGNWRFLSILDVKFWLINIRSEVTSETSRSRVFHFVRCFQRCSINFVLTLFIARFAKIPLYRFGNLARHISKFHT